MEKWTFWVDCGGTFTDIIAVDAGGNHRVHKLLSHSPHYESAVVHGITEVLGHRNFQQSIRELRLGTTVATNAFLEKKGVPCALVTTLGHRDLLEIRQQNRPDLFALDIHKTPPLYSYVTQVQGRMDAQGRVIVPLDREIAEFELRRIFDQGIRSLAISLLHATINPQHELILEALAKDIGFDYVSTSHRVSPIAKVIPRTETSVMDAYLSPYLIQYTEKLEQELGIQEIYYMQSDGGLCLGRELKGYNALLSGPAGGLVGAIRSAKARGYEKIISFDMGGTSSDVAIYDGELNLEQEPDFYGLKLLAPMVDIHTVAAGGGSVLKYDGQRFVVGPDSAGAFPGPACYRNGGPLTITDANLFLGRLEADKFPKVFGSARNQPLDQELVSRKFSELADQVGITPQEVAEGFLDVAVETMARAIRKVTIERGQDPKDFTLVSFGGAGGQLATRVADSLQIKEILVHSLSSVLSAYGIGLAPQSLLERGRVEQGHDQLKENLKRKVDSESFEFTPYYLLNAKDSDHSVEIQAENLLQAKETFKEYYKKVFGIDCEGEIQCQSIALKAEKKTEFLPEIVRAQETPFFYGKSVITENNTSIVVEEGWSGSKNQYGDWILRRESQGLGEKSRDLSIEMEIFYQRFQFIADQMGFVLQRMAQSVNIKERRDFSCALFTASGELLSNAPHIPVHLGSMSDAVKCIAKKVSVQEGESYICNDPFLGGTHLPDITVVTPLYSENNLVMWVASRGHHADIGGISPGSMPGGSTTLEEEGVVIPPLPIVRDGEFRREELVKILSSGKYPARKVELNIHDIKAKLAANKKGLEQLNKLFSIHGQEKVLRMAEAILDYSDTKMKTVMKAMRDSSASRQVTHDRHLNVRVRKQSGRLQIDFSGTSPSQNNNFNAPFPVVKASVLFVLRSMIVEGIPLNDGILRSIDIHVPKNSLLNPEPNRAVVAGNVETSQAICDLLFEVFGIKANSQGTMNNLSFGNNEFQYYETLAGGSGATKTADGSSGVQVNMTNSLLTDPEVLESRFPVIVEFMGLRRGSGGLGERKGGDGIYRRLRVLQPMEIAMLSQSRVFPPKGLNGGKAALRGRNLLESDDEVIELDECFQISVNKDDVIAIETPGGGGHCAVKEKFENVIFVFGSNMDIHQLLQRCPGARIIRRGVCRDVELRYTRYSEKRKGGVADMYQSEGSFVIGLLIMVSDKDLQSLDEIECNDKGYQRINVQIEDDNGELWQAQAYDVVDKVPDVIPTKIYEWQVYSGAYCLNAPASYLGRIRRFQGP